MKILQLTAENVKRIKVVDITPDPDVVKVTGKNGHGKTSVLDSIWWALDGKKNIQRTPIRTGAEEARIRLDFGEIIVIRRFNKERGTTKLEIRERGKHSVDTPDNKLPKAEAPQELLDTMLGQLSFDPLKFKEMSPDEQFEELRRISKLSVDIDALDAANAEDYKLRTDINRDAKAKRVQADGIDVRKDLPAEEIDETKLLNAIQEAGEHNASIESRKARRQQAERDVSDLESEAQRILDSAELQKKADEVRVSELRKEAELLERNLQATYKAAKKEAADVTKRAAELAQKLAKASPLPEPISVTDLRTKLDEAREINEEISAAQTQQMYLREAAEYEKQSAEITARMKGRDQEKLDAIKAAEMPVEGLGFGKGFVTYNDLPFDQASDAEQLRISVSIAMSANPEIRVIRIRNASLLDEDGVATIAEMARKHDYQVWMEMVDSSGKVGVYMEDGEVKSQ